MDRIKISSLNVRGLDDRLKCKRLYKFIRHQKFGIFMIQEIYVDPKTRLLWESEWGGQVCFTPGTSKSKGVAIYFDNKLGAKINKISEDPEGRWLLVTIEVEEKEFLLVKIYAPNNDSLSFFKALTQKIDKENVIIAGDFNLVLDQELDYKNRKTNNDKALKVLLSFMDEYGLEDMWRIFHPQDQIYTCFKKKPIVAARLDYFLVSQGLVSSITCTQIEYATFSDHSLVSLLIDIDSFKRGPGVWRLNCRLLENEEIIEEARKLITFKLKQNRHLPTQESWELLKSDMAEYCKQCGCQVASENKQKIETLT